MLPANDLTLGLFLVNADVTVANTLECEQDDKAVDSVNIALLFDLTDY